MADPTGTSTLRLDKWLWQARFFKSRSLAAAQCRARKVRVNGNLCSKASVAVQVGDVLTFPKAGDIRVIEVVALGTRRGPATEAQTLYTDLTPPKPEAGRDEVEAAPAGPVRLPGSGRPTKAERRATDRLRDR
ncbi:MAG: RNA-binding S4 domain-containing protein [Kordiimonadaceae bacterium]|nr:RNA-binding S4 domain-containing protein [Kordiimonadaceae bacterium]MBO6568493.1 RNA-binding S4 domain-containing protein [Kordiimonadaceae bacterium]MBO6963778.1 RNA-binding S4 domain-containing protein [Kordiimonadaceae bacterium]